MKPYITIEEINEEWQHIKNENIQNIEINLLAIDDKVVIAQWILKQNNVNILANSYDDLRFQEKQKLHELERYEEFPNLLSEVHKLNNIL